MHTKFWSRNLKRISPNTCNITVIKSKMRWAGHVAHMGEMGNACTTLVGKTERKRPFERPRRRWENKIRMDLRETGWKGVYLMHLAQVGTSGGLL
jgi:hypothetical protein